MVDSYGISGLRMCRILKKIRLDITPVIIGSVILISSIESDQKFVFRMNRFLLKSPLDMVITLSLYFIMVHVGPTLMKKRQPFSLKNTIIVYNVIQIVSNIALFLLILPRIKTLNIWCFPPHTSDSDMDLLDQQLHHYYVLLKYFDLIETVFYVLRKKENQISFLHVYHHSGILSAAWISGMYFPGGQASFVAIFNTFVHAIMYCYYLATSCNSNFKGYLGMKKYVTVLQIVQHILILLCIFPAVLNSNCSYPKPPTVIFSFTVLVTIFLFFDFYKKAYLVKSE